MSRMFWRSVVGLVVAAAGPLAALAQAQTPPSVYVTNGDRGSVSQYERGRGGLLAPLVPPTVATELQPYGVAVSPDGGSVYVTNAVTDNVSQYDVGPGGALTPKSPPTVARATARGVAVSPDGGSVYVANAGQRQRLPVRRRPGRRAHAQEPADGGRGRRPVRGGGEPGRRQRLRHEQHHPARHRLPVRRGRGRRR